MIERDESKRYTVDNLLSKVSNSIKTFNELIDCKPFKVLMVSHRQRPLELYYIDEHGISNKVFNYMSIGTGKEIANMLCGDLDHINMEMKEFIKHAYLAIMYMDRYCSGLGVGVEPESNPDIKYIGYNDEWDIDPAEKRPQDIMQCKNYTDAKLEEVKQAFQSIKEYSHTVLMQ